MSGIFHEGHWYGNTDMVCRRCGSPVYKSDNSEYSYQCFRCDEDLYSFEVTEQDGLYLPRVVVARPVNGITLSERVEYAQREILDQFLEDMEKVIRECICKYAVGSGNSDIQIAPATVL